MQGLSMRICATIFAAILAATGCQASGATDEEAKLFENLRSHEWTAAGPGAEGFKEFLRIRRDRTYHWQRQSDYLERDDRGTWSVIAEKDSTGLLRLSDCTETRCHVDVKGNKLWLGWRALTRGKPITYAAGEINLGVGDLKAVEPSESFKRLTSTAWVKTNRFDDYRLADRIEFQSDGRYTASYRNGACSHGGSWGLFHKSDGRKPDRATDLEYAADYKKCDLRGGRGGGVGYRLTFVDDLLLLGAPYAPASNQPKRNVFIFDRYGESVRTRGEFDGDFLAGRSTRVDLLHESATGAEFQLLSL